MRAVFVKLQRPMETHIPVIEVGKGNEECIDLDWLESATYTQLLIK
jgi:hypothetical protein